MEHRAFTEGIAMGGLTTDYEARLLVCWLLHKVETSMTMEQLNIAVSTDALVNYFELANAVGTLLSSGHIVGAETDGQSEQPFLLTELGQQTALVFEKEIPHSVREKSLAAAKRALQRERMERENKAQITKTPDGYRLMLEFCDVKSSLLELSMYVPTFEMAQRMKNKFLCDPTVLYRELIKLLSSEEL